MAVSTLLLAILALTSPLLAYAEVWNLSDLQWTLKNQNGTIAIPAEIPSQAHLDLLRAGIITEPLLGINGKTIISTLGYLSKFTYATRIYSTVDR